MDGYKVQIYVVNDSHDSANGKEFTFPIIPRVGDLIDVKYKIDEKNHPNLGVVGVFEVKRVYIHEFGSKYDATLHVEGDEEIA
ncbi:Hypothetical protein Tpal_491 [Trichococcus palustris]|uniref:Uncharacterized protein n=1 Tax=Trichococcus palustris TaxID=140314 RepID=A0A143YCV1_9LACT|nr:hypothetical protein [Trichococcus palustris]CZQ83818.1 Hypothetical protein Tpal_491 [Trichococcus palustris]SFK70651.1 hypothetical protein SAMN04488076_103200 [Trichococcus palustris]